MKGKAFGLQQNLKEGNDCVTMPKSVCALNCDNDKAIIDIRLCPWCATQDELLLVFLVEQNLVGTSAVILVRFYCSL